MWVGPQLAVVVAATTTSMPSSTEHARSRPLLPEQAVIVTTMHNSSNKYIKKTHKRYQAQIIRSVINSSSSKTKVNRLPITTLVLSAAHHSKQNSISIATAMDIIIKFRSKDCQWTKCSSEERQEATNKSIPFSITIGHIKHK